MNWILCCLLLGSAVPLRAQTAEAPLRRDDLELELNAYRRLLMDWGG